MDEKYFKKTIIKAVNEITNVLFDNKINIKGDFYKVIALVLRSCSKANNTDIDFKVLKEFTESIDPIINIKKHPIEKIMKDQCKRVEDKINEEIKNANN